MILAGVSRVNEFSLKQNLQKSLHYKLYVRVRFPSPSPFIYPSLRTVYRSDRAVGILILTTVSMSLKIMWRLD